MNFDRNWNNQASYIERVLSIFSRSFNVIFLNGSINESISSRAYRILHVQGIDSRTWKFYAWAANKLYFWEENHIEEAYHFNLNYCEQFIENHYLLIEKLHEEKNILQD